MTASTIVIDDMPGSLIHVYRRSRLRNPDTEAVMRIVADMQPGQARQLRYPGPPERRMSWMVRCGRTCTAAGRTSKSSGGKLARGD